jgi:hypothetical protein
MNVNQQTAPLFPLESAEKWAAIRKTAEGGNAKKLRDLLEEIELSPKLSPVFTVAVAEEAELQAVVAAGEGQAERVRQCRAQAGHVGATQPETFEEAEQLAKQRVNLMDEGGSSRPASREATPLASLFLQ